jgi:outer membrane murein-binding lipoprotein Lpp
MREFTKLGTAVVALGLLGLAGCASRSEVNSLKSEVDSLSSRVAAAESTASEAQAAATQCTAICNDVAERSERMFQESLRK